jgi:hypothetical protein
MSYYNRTPSGRRAGSAEFFGLMLVLAAGAATFWWAGHKIGMDLSSLATAATVLGIRDTHPLRYDPRTAAQPTTIQIADETAAQEAPAAQEAAVEQDVPAVSAPYCSPGQAPAFVHGLGALKEHLGDTMGTPLECEHPSTAIGDTIQQTSTGLAAYNKLTNTVTFTDGWRHWALRGDTVVTWEGTQSDPPTG